MMSLWDALRMNMMISYQELVRTFPNNGDLMSGASALYSIWEANQGDLSRAITAGVIAVIGQGFARLKPSFQSVRRKPNDNIAYLSCAHNESILKKP